MNREIASEWARRMGSGTHVQGTGWLRQTGPGGRPELCAWGVLCEMAVDAKVIRAPRRCDSEDYWLYEGCAAWPPTAVLEWADIELDEHGYPVELALSVIAAKNDSDEDFSVIADLVRRELVDVGRVLAAASV